MHAGACVERHDLTPAPLGLTRAAGKTRLPALQDMVVAGQWQAGEAGWTPEARAIFAELELADGVRRSLLESPTFRAMLRLSP